MAPVRTKARAVVELRRSRPLPAPFELPQVATQAMQRFGCIQGACEDTCCRDWGISIDVDDLEQMQRVAAQRNLGDGLFHLVVLGKPAPGTSSRTFMKLKDDGSCPLLETSGACSIHRVAGEEALSTTCSIFPRSSLVLPTKQLEITGSLGCPELARLTLLADDGTAQTPTSKQLLPREYVGKTIAESREDGTQDAYAAAFIEVRETMLALVEDSTYPLGARLMMLTHLAVQVGSFFHAGTTAFEGSERTFSRRKLTRELRTSLDPRTQKEIAADLAAFAGANEVVLTSTISFLLERQKLTHPERFARVLQTVFSSLQGEALGCAAEPGQSVTPADLVAVVQRRQDGVQARLPALVSKVLGNYVRHYLLRHPYTDAPTLQDYLGRLFVQLAAIRLLLAGHPEIEALLAQAPHPEDGGAFSRAAVEVIQSFTKAVTHNLPFLDAVLGANTDSGGFSFGRLALYAKFV